MEFFDANKIIKKPSTQASSVRGTRPPRTLYKVNFDATIFENLGYAGLGVVIQYSDRELIAALSQWIGLPSSVEMEEALVARKAVAFAQELSIFKVVVEGDCL